MDELSLYIAKLKHIGFKPDFNKMYQNIISHSQPKFKLFYAKIAVSFVAILLVAVGVLYFNVNHKQDNFDSAMSYVFEQNGNSEVTVLSYIFGD